MPIAGQTSAIVGTAKVGLTVVGEILQVAGGMPSQLEEDVRKPNPWTRRAVQTTTWTPR